MRRLISVKTLVAMAVAGVAVAVVAPSALAARSAADPGLTAFNKVSCGACHTLAAAKAKGTVGPNLDKKKPTAALVTARVTAGKGIMPSFKGKLTAAQIKAIATFITKNAGKKVTAPATTAKAATSTKAATTAAAAAPAAAPAAAAGPETLLGDPVAGAKVYADAGCGTCHTMKAAGSTGNVGPDLDGRKPTQGVLKAVVQSGAVAGGLIMPQFSLSPTDLNNLAAYVYASTH